MLPLTSIIDALLALDRTVVAFQSRYSGTSLAYILLVKNVAKGISSGLCDSHKMALPTGMSWFCL